MVGRRPDTTKVYNFLKNFRDTGPNWVSFPQHFKTVGNYTTLGSGKIYHTNCAPKAWTCDECTVEFSENQPPNQDQPYSWSQDKTYETPCQEYCPPKIPNASVPSTTCPVSVLGPWLSPSHPDDLFALDKHSSGIGVTLNTSGCQDCAFSSADGHTTSTGVEIILSFTTKPERDLVVGTLHSHSCELRWTTNSTSASGHFGSWWRHSTDPAPAFSTGTRGYAACGDPSPFTAFNDYNSTTTALANLEYAVTKGGAFFIAMGVFKPHYPWHVPQQFADLYEQKSITLPNVSAQHAPVGFSPWGWDRGLDGLTQFRILNSSAPGGSLDVPVNGPASAMPRWAFQSMRKGYYSAVSWSDHLIGMMLDKMDTLGVTDSTVTVLTSDHGYHLGEGGMWAKETVFEDATHVPLIIRAPWLGQSSIGFTSSFFELIDLYPTVAELAGVASPTGLDGTSQAAVMRSPKQIIKQHAFSQFPRCQQEARFCLPPASEIQVMGISLRTADARYTEWWPWNGQQLRISWANGTLGSELYLHQGDPSYGSGMFDAWENVNHAHEQQYQGMVRDLAAVLRSQFDSG